MRIEERERSRITQRMRKMRGWRGKALHSGFKTYTISLLKAVEAVWSRALMLRYSRI